jgi:hypothetical protein
MKISHRFEADSRSYVSNGVDMDFTRTAPPGVSAGVGNGTTTQNVRAPKSSLTRNTTYLRFTTQ